MSDPKGPLISTFPGLQALLDRMMGDNARDWFFKSLEPQEEVRAIEGGRCFCSICLDVTRVRATASPEQFQEIVAQRVGHDSRIGENEKLKRQASVSGGPVQLKPAIDKHPLPLRLRLECLRCGKARPVLVAYRGPDGPEVIILHEHRGAGSPETPNDVAYYLDQARRASGAGAHSAAASMYRAAVEMMLFGFGYKQRMLGPKLDALRKDRIAGTAKPSAILFDDEFADLARQLGNGAIHANKGAAKRQRALDADVVAAVESVINGVLRRVYDEPAADKLNRKKIREAAKRLGTRKK